MALRVTARGAAPYAGRQVIENMKMMQENTFSPFGKFATIILFALLCVIAIGNIIKGHVPTPYAFYIVIAGFCLFASAKIVNMKKGKLLSFGTKNMSENVANTYRVGYWLMIAGLIITFV